jgi:hypothetical protein
LGFQSLKTNVKTIEGCIILKNNQNNYPTKLQSNNKLLFNTIDKISEKKTRFEREKE